MIDLSEITGLPIKYDEDKARLCCGEEIELDEEYSVKLSELLPVLLNKYLRYPENVYKHHRNIRVKAAPSDFDARYDLIYLPFGLLGIEFIKTHVFYSEPADGKNASVVEVLHGTLTVVIQRNRPKDDPYEFETYVDEIAIITLRTGERLVIPTGVYYTFVNTGIVPVLFSKVTSHRAREVDYSNLKREKGLAYFLISKNAKIEVVANPKYKISCKLKYLNMRRLMNEQLSPYVKAEIHSSKGPLFNLLREKIVLESVCV